MSTLSYGLNITKKPSSLTARPPPAKRKTIFDDDSGPEDGPDDEDNAESIDTIGGLTTTSSKTTKPKPGIPTSKPSKPSQISQYGDLSTLHSISRHVKTAQTLDASIYDYDSVYDSLHAKPQSASTEAAEAEKRPRYMSDLLAAAETRKRDQLRAKEKMLAKEREAEGDEFADKEKFVTAAYKRQQVEMHRLEEEEAIKEKEAEERKKREGGGLKGLYKIMLDKNEQKHAAVVKAVEEAKTNPSRATDGGDEKPSNPSKTETDLAREKGAIINEDGQIVDKRQLLTAGLNPSSSSSPSSSSPRNLSSRATPASKPRLPSRANDPKSRNPAPRTGPSAGRASDASESARERETRLFEDQVLGKRRVSHGDGADGEGEEGRAAKSRRLEDEILGLGR